MHNLSPIALVGLAAGLSLLPLAAWGFFFLYRTTEKRHVIIKTIAMGAVMVVPLVIYRALWQSFPAISLTENLRFLNNYNQVKLAGITTYWVAFYASVGMIEEYFKHIVVKNVDRNEIDSIKDSIEFSIMAALGFAFAENTFKLIQTYYAYGSDMLFQVFLFRAFFSTFAHLLFSSVYGYHFGVTLHANQIDKKKFKKTRLYKIGSKIYNKLGRNPKKLFTDRHHFVGLSLAVMLHATFNLLLEANITMFLIPFLLLGIVHVSYLLYNANSILKKPTK